VFIPDPVLGYVSGVVDSLKIGGSAGGGSIILEERVPSKAERLAGSSSLSPVTKYAWRLRPRNGDTHARCARARARTVQSGAQSNRSHRGAGQDALVRWRRSPHAKNGR